MLTVDTRLFGATFLACLLCSAGLSFAETDTDATERLPGQEGLSARSFAEFASGYRFVSPDGFTARANPYGVNRSGLTAQFAAGFLGPDLKLRTDGLFLHSDDYQGELFVDYGGLVKAELESRSMFHNLVRRPAFASFTSTSAPLATYNYLPSGDRSSLGIASRLDRVDTRVRFGSYPAHLSLGYWRLTQSGSDQVVVAEVERLNAVNNFYDTTRRIDHVTQEGRVGLDASLGPVNLAYNFRIRDYNNNAPPLTAPFAVAVPAESRVISNSIKAYSDLSGGLTAAVAYSITQRENTSQRTDLTINGRPQDTIQQLSGDISYTPIKELSLVLKYRRHQIQRETPSLISSIYSNPGSYQVRPGTSSSRDTLILASSWRPDPQITFRGEYRADLISRDNVWVPMTGTTTLQTTSDTSQLHTGTMSLHWRPLRFTRVNATYSYSSNSQPTTQNDFSDRHVGNLLVDWSSNGRFGINTHYRATSEQNNMHSSTTSAPVTALVTARNSLNQSAGVSGWFSPLQKLVLTVTYGCIVIDADQALLFSPQSASSLTTTSYSSVGHIYGVDAVYAATDKLDLSFALQQVRSRAEFTVPGQVFALAGPPLYPAATTSGIGSFNRLDATESSASARIDWRFAKHFGWGMDYRFSAYRSDDAQYNGDIHSTTVSLTARW